MTYNPYWRYQRLVLAQKYYFAPTAINYSSKLMSAAQELFQLFIVYFNSRLNHRRAAVRLLLCFNGKTRVADGIGIRKEIAKVIYEGAAGEVVDRSRWQRFHSGY